MPPVTDLLARIESADVALEQRIDAAHALAAEGDPRARASDRVIIPGGAFAMGDPARQVPLAAYGIDRYPVTVAAYAAFIESGGYGDRRFWTAEGWDWRKEGAIERPRFWGEDEWQAYLFPNHPVVGVSFYEAEAYAAFGGGRLPTEAEWEKAARGVDGRKYPWGNAWRDDACGMRGVGPRSTVPIGVFPKGQSPYGVRDLVGCVWQWCSDPFVGWGGSADDDERAPDLSGAPPRRTTCGGAWNTLQWSVSCLGRNGYPTTARFSNLGFRCVSPA
ncbi:MAG TPA: SUMF1/EgtB/PvdO family nonheme iron enzyme [Polyangiaceae bacterium]|nr:SUMF1/EgtB/PvdO family nonheme iron enzyme [Polyangiaceae bacterium]